MKHTNSRFVVARLMLLVLTLAITVFSFASCEGLPPEVQGLLGGNPNANCEHEYDNACDFNCNKCGAVLIGFPEHYYDNDCDTDCNECGATRKIEHTYVNGVCSVCGAVDESVPACQHTNVENCVCKDCNASVHNVEFIPYNAPACHKNGNYEFYLCRDCNGFFSDAEAKNELTGTDKINIQIIGFDHSYDNGHDTVCNACDFEREPVHTFDNDCDTDCNECDATREIEHTYVNGVCSVCGDVDESVPACDHTTVENCVCKDCGEEFHKSIELLIPAGDATCDIVGSDVDIYACYDCEHFFLNAEGIGAMTEDEVLAYEGLIMPTGHNMVNSEYGTYCTKCDYNGPEGVNAAHSVNTETCICEDCGATIHTFTGDDDNCIYCGESHTHKMRFIPAREATCTRTGYAFDVYKCEICEKLYTDAEGENRVDREDWIIDRLGHNYVNGTCDVCGRKNSDMPSDDEKDASDNPSES